MVAPLPAIEEPAPLACKPMAKFPPMLIAVPEPSAIAPPETACAPEAALLPGMFTVTPVALRALPVPIAWRPISPLAAPGAETLPPFRRTKPPFAALAPMSPPAPKTVTAVPVAEIELPGELGQKSPLAGARALDGDGAVLERNGRACRRPDADVVCAGADDVDRHIARFDRAVPFREHRRLVSADRIAVDRAVAQVDLRSGPAAMHGEVPEAERRDDGDVVCDDLTARADRPQPLIAAAVQDVEDRALAERDMAAIQRLGQDVADAADCDPDAACGYFGPCSLGEQAGEADSRRRADGGRAENRTGAERNGAPARRRHGGQKRREDVDAIPRDLRVVRRRDAGQQGARKNCAGGRRSVGVDLSEDDGTDRGGRRFD